MFIMAAAVERVALVRARLAAEEKEALEAIKADICQWLGNQDVLALDIMPASFLNVLDSGVQLCKLARLVQEGAKRRQADGSGLIVRVPLQPLAWKSIKAPRGTAMFQASSRDNAALFIQWCRDLGVEEAVIFESVGLVEHKDERRLILCLLDVARFAEKVGIVAPRLVQLEREIDLLESEPAPAVASGKEEDVGIEVSSPVETSETGRGVVTEQLSEEGGEVSVELNQDAELTGEGEGGKEEHSEREVVLDEGTSEKDEQVSAEEEPPAKRVKHASSGDSRGPDQPTPQHTHDSQPTPQHTHDSQPTHHRRSTPHSRQSPGHSQHLSGSKKNTVDKKVMQCMGECTCEHTIQVQNCGRGKFTVHPRPQTGNSKKINIYARLLSDRVMVRVGGGWETLEHFLLKHDPCRIDHITAHKSQTSSSVRKRGREV